MSVELEAGHETDWLRPDKCPKGFDTDTVYFGRKETGLAEFEIAVGKWSGDGTPTRDDLNKLHAARLNKRAVPVLLAIELPGGGDVTFGPNVDVALVGPLPADQANLLPEREMAIREAVELTRDIGVGLGTRSRSSAGWL